MPELRGVALRTREVLADECLYARYATRVPVLRIGDAELDWPFEIERLRQLLATDRNTPQHAALAISRQNIER